MATYHKCDHCNATMTQASNEQMLEAKDGLRVHVRIERGDDPIGPSMIHTTYERLDICAKCIAEIAADRFAEQLRNLQKAEVAHAGKDLHPGQ